MRAFILIFAIIGTAGAAVAGCPANSPDPSRFNTVEGDQRVNTSWLERTLGGKRLVFQVGTEHYNADGSYRWQTGNQSWDAPGYRFYNNGFRCIDYPAPRFDFYVVNDGKLILINGNGERYVGRIRN